MSACIIRQKLKVLSSKYPENVLYCIVFVVMHCITVDSCMIGIGRIVTRRRKAETSSSLVGYGLEGRLGFSVCVAVIAAQRRSERYVLPLTLLRRWNMTLPRVDGEDHGVKDISSCSRRSLSSIPGGKCAIRFTSFFAIAVSEPKISINVKNVYFL